MVRMSLEKVNSNTERDILSRQERIDRLGQPDQLNRLRQQRDAINKFYKSIKKGDTEEENESKGYTFSVGTFVDPNGVVWDIRNRFYGKRPEDWQVVCCGFSENSSDGPKVEVQSISDATKTERDKWSFLPCGINAVDILRSKDGEVINVFWKSEKDSKPVVGDSSGREFLPLAEIVDNVDADKNRFENIVYPLIEEGVGQEVRQDTEESLGVSAVSSVILL